MADHPEDMAQRVAAGQIDDEAAAWLRAGFSRWARDDGEIGLERHLRLLTTPGQRRRRRRDHLLVQVARELGPSESTPARAVHDALVRFVTRGPWRAWRDLPAPPPGTSRLYSALHALAVASEGRPLSMRRVEQVLRGAEISAEKFRPGQANMRAVNQDGGG